MFIIIIIIIIIIRLMRSCHTQLYTIKNAVTICKICKLR